jgi:hypothetical protein
VIGWNRATVADGQWLQDNAIGPLSARDMYLADCIDDIWGSVNSINQTLDNMGAETTGVNTFGFTMKSVNIAQAESPSAAYLPNNVNWDRKQVSLVTTGVGDTYMTPGSISLLTFTNASEKINGIDAEGLGDNMGALLQVNTTANEAYQLAFTPNALYYRRISDVDGQTVPLPAGHAGTNLFYKEDPPDFTAFPLGAMTQTQADARYLSITNFGTYTGTTAPGQFVSKTDYGTFTGKAITTGNIDTVSYQGSNYVTAISGMKVVSPSQLPEGGLVAVSHDATLTGDGTSTTALGVAYAPSASYADALSGADGTLTFAQITAAINDKSVVTVSENAPWVSTISVDNTAHSIFNPYDHTSNLFEVTGTDAKKLELKYNTSDFTADATNGLSLATIEITGTDSNNVAWTATKAISAWIQHIVSNMQLPAPT